MTTPNDNSNPSLAEEPRKDRYGAFLLYVDDWLSSTAIDLMTAGEERGYLRLLMHAWKSPDCGLPDDDKVLGVLSKLGRAWRGPSGTTLRAQFTLKDGRLYNERLLRERQHQQQVRESRRGAAKTAANIRWNASRIPDAQQKDASSNPSPNLREEDIDCAPTNRKERDSSPRVDGLPNSKIRQYPRLKEVLRRYFSEPGQDDLVPSDRTVADTMDAAGGATEEEVIAGLRYLHGTRGLRPGTKNGPKHWSWFPTVVQDYFEKKRLRDESANPCGFHEWEDCNDAKEHRAEIDAGIAAIEIPDDPDACTE